MPDRPYPSLANATRIWARIGLLKRFGETLNRGLPKSAAM